MTAKTDLQNKAYFIYLFTFYLFIFIKKHINKIKMLQIGLQTLENATCRAKLNSNSIKYYTCTCDILKDQYQKSIHKYEHIKIY